MPRHWAIIVRLSVELSQTRVTRPREEYTDAHNIVRSVLDNNIIKSSREHKAVRLRM